MNRVFLLLGSNLGDRFSYLKQAITLISRHIGQVVRQSAVYETASWGNEQQPDYLNQVLEIETKLSPEDLLSQVLKIEKTMGRIRHEKWGARIIDIDILFYDNRIVDESDLIIPHPYLHQRRFTLVPLVELAPDFMHPKLKQPLKELLEALTDNLEVRKVIG
ncbi:2-amino-4-hydroxy-6-hydroxymethyldihydropteridine diphosphokinase [Pedobacter sp. BS3]|uniref:2-amino-4-hydroxy-6- hydroxymethyldihydropteridine diphosphokinase n=1 Tax=Pedobacter sp. BS3 TaxID=2567937 RepID=UPI0011ED1E1A|nr:2-amino-4-hydroxy-6-hydroxymethyldihydropteridine diphosphokinase [Pedobacter sp. BS3]TZF82693.1 2-amino-4-hydroxy-6-hydroxymethyldihydropteridine diphosphokinase [Pedobacter sp. BS3]